MFDFYKCNSLFKANMVSTRKNTQQSRTWLSQLDDFYQGVTIGDAVISEKQNFVSNKSIADRDLTVNNNDSLAVTNEKAVDVRTLEIILTDRIARVTL